MKILHISRGYADYLHGMLRAIPSGHEVLCIMPEGDAKKLGALPRNVGVHDLHPPRVRSAWNLVFVFRLIRLIRHFKPDLIHLQAGLVWELASVVWFRRVPVVLTIHDVSHHPTATRFVFTPSAFQKLAIRLSDAAIVHAEALKRQLIDGIGGLMKGRVFVMPHGPIVRYGTHGPRVNTGKSLLFFGVIDKYKGLEYLVKAMMMVWERHPDATLTIAGRNVLGASVGELFRPDSRERVCLIERYVDDCDVAKLFSEADILVLPYIEGSQSGVLSLAISFSLPVVATRVGGIGEFVATEGLGKVVAPADAGELSQALCGLLEDRSGLRWYSENMARKRQAQFSQQRRVLQETYDTAFALAWRACRAS